MTRARSVVQVGLVDLWREFREEAIRAARVVLPDPERCQPYSDGGIDPWAMGIAGLGSCHNRGWSI